MVNGINSSEYQQLNNKNQDKTNSKSKLNQSVQVVTDSYENNTTGKMISGNTSDPDVFKKTMLLLPPIYLLDKFADKLIGGKGGDGALGKAASLGDKISGALHLDNIVSSEKEGKLSSFIKNNRFTKYFTNDYKAIPKSSFAKSQTMTQKYSQEIINNLLSLEKNQDLAHLFKYGEEGALSPETLNTFYKIGSSEASKTTTTELIKAVDEVMDKGVTSVPKGRFGKANFSELKNKLKASDMKMGKTKIGSAFAKGSLKTKDLLTYGGGLISLAFAANAIVQAVKATKEAPEGEKKSTFMHVLSENYIGIALFTPSINLLYKMGGNKYRGMSVEGRNAYKDFIARTNAGTLTKEGYKIAKLQEKLLLNGVSKDKVENLAGKSLSEAKKLASSLKNEGSKLKLWEKPLKAMGKLLDTGLDTIKSPSAAGKIKGKLKGFTGGLGRLLLIMMVIQPVIQKPVTKLVHKIFGEPKTYLAKQENTENAETPELQNPTANNQNETYNATNLLNKWSNNTAAYNQQPVNTIAQQQNFVNSAPNAQEGYNSQIPAANLENNINADNSSQTQESQNDNAIAASGITDSNKNRYIPSIQPSQFENNDEQIRAEVETTLKNTDALMKKTKKAL